MSFHDFLVLEDIARRLARRYPPDWLERNGQPIYAATLAASFLLAVLLGLAWGPWWGFLVPLLTPGLLLVVLPRRLLGREPGRPRWAHRLVVLDPQDAALAGRIAALEAGPVMRGDRFFDIWQHARCVVQYGAG